jgi:hypothetical protein
MAKIVTRELLKVQSWGPRPHVFTEDTRDLLDIGGALIPTFLV